MGVADGGYAHDRNTDRRDDKADHGGYDIPSGQLTEVNGEDQIAGAEEHAEQRSGHQNLLLESKVFFHFFCLLLFDDILTFPLHSEKSMFIIGVLENVIDMKWSAAYGQQETGNSHDGD